MSPFTKSETREAMVGLLLDDPRGPLNEPIPHRDERGPVESYDRTADPLNILVAEDNPVNQKLIARILEKHGHRVELTPDGEAVIEACLQNEYDIILMDIEMPVRDGIEAARRIRSEEKERGLKCIPILALTARATMSGREACLRAAMDGYITKPIRFEELRNAVRAVIEVDRSDQTAGYNAARWPSEVVDRNALYRVSDGDPTFLIELVAIFSKTGPERLREIQLALQQRDCVQLRRAAHSLKGAAATLYAQRTYEQATRVEQLARRRDLREARLIVAQLEEEMAHLRDALEAVRAECRPHGS